MTRNILIFGVTESVCVVTCDIDLVLSPLSHFLFQFPPICEIYIPPVPSPYLSTSAGAPSFLSASRVPRPQQHRAPLVCCPPLLSPCSRRSVSHAPDSSLTTGGYPSRTPWTPLTCKTAVHIVVTSARRLTSTIPLRSPPPAVLSLLPTSTMPLVAKYPP